MTNHLKQSLKYSLAAIALPLGLSVTLATPAMAQNLGTQGVDMKSIGTQIKGAQDINDKVNEAKKMLDTMTGKTKPVEPVVTQPELKFPAAEPAATNSKVTTPTTTPATTKTPLTKATGAKGLLANASDGALDKLSQPGAFYKDEAVRILLPGPLKKATNLLRYTDQAGLTKDITRSLNDAAGQAALAAKPVFRSAIDKLTLTDGVGIVTGGGTSATEYLRKSSGDELALQIRPLVEKALGDTGAFRQVDRLGSLSSLATLGGADLSHEGLTKSVTDQAMNGIFKYIGSEETKFRANPLGSKGADVLKGLFQ